MATEKSAATVKVNTAPSAPRRESKALKYLGEVRNELKKTHWPTRQELIAQTQLTFGLLLVVGGFIAAWDTVLGFLFQGLMDLLGVTRTR